MVGAKESVRDVVVRILQSNGGELLESQLIKKVAAETLAHQDFIEEVLENLEEGRSIIRASVDGMVELV